MVGLGAGWLTVLEPGITAPGLAGPLLMIGVGVGLSIGMVDAMAINSVVAARAATAAGMINTARLASETVAIAVVGSVLATTTGGRLADPGFTDGLHAVLWSSAGLAVAAVLLTAVLLRRGAGTATQPAPHPVTVS